MLSSKDEAPPILIDPSTLTIDPQVPNDLRLIALPKVQKSNAEQALPILA
jgi:hypothetical protein